MAKSKDKVDQVVVPVQEVGSGANALSKTDLEKWAKNLVIFFAPAGIIFLMAVQAGTPIKDALLPVYAWAVNVLIDLLKKFKTDNT